MVLVMDEEYPIPPPILLFALASVSGASGLFGQSAAPEPGRFGTRRTDAFPFVQAPMHQDKGRRQHDQGVANMLNSLGRKGELLQDERGRNFRIYNGSFYAPRDPDQFDDAADGIDLGAQWVNDETGAYWLNTSNTPGNAEWIMVDDAEGGLTGEF